METPRTLQEAIIFFSDAERAFQYALQLRFPNGNVSCPRCSSDKHSFVKTRRLWHCKGCKKQFSLKVGTIFEDSPLGLDKWMMAMWLLSACKNGISSYELSRAIGVTQRSAWFMLHRLREVMRAEHNLDFPIGNSPANQVEIDETYIGGKPKNMHASRRIKREQEDHKAIVMGMRSRTTREVRAKVIPNVKRETLQAEILRNVGWGSVIYTDQHVGYDNVSKLNNYGHKTVNHMTEYVNGKVHTQGIENFWSGLKRTLNGTYVAVEPFHLDRYVAEQVFRFNNNGKKMNDAKRFELAMTQVAGRRLTYSELTGTGSTTTHT